MTFELLQERRILNLNLSEVYRNEDLKGGMCYLEDTIKYLSKTWLDPWYDIDVQHPKYAKPNVRQNQYRL